MSNRSYLIGLFIGLATFAIACLLLFGNFFANANNRQPQISPSEMNAIANNYQYLSNPNDRKVVPKLINNYYENQFKNPNELHRKLNQIKINQLPKNKDEQNDSQSKRSSS